MTFVFRGRWFWLPTALSAATPTDTRTVGGLRSGRGSLGRIAPANARRAAGPTCDRGRGRIVVSRPGWSVEQRRAFAVARAIPLGWHRVARAVTVRSAAGETRSVHAPAGVLGLARLRLASRRPGRGSTEAEDGADQAANGGRAAHRGGGHGAGVDSVRAGPGGGSGNGSGNNGRTQRRSCAATRCTPSRSLTAETALARGRSSTPTVTASRHRGPSR